MSVSHDDVLYDYLPGEEDNPLMEGALHARWAHLLIGAVRHELAGTGALVTGNVPWIADDGGPRVAADMMVVPGLEGEMIGAFRPGANGPMASAVVEILSPSNRGARFDRRLHRFLELGVPELYVVDPLRAKVARVSVGEFGELRYTDALGVPSPALRITFERVGDELVVCCPAGRVVSTTDDPFGWIVEAERRADAERQRADRAEATARQAEEAARQAEEAARQAEDTARVAEATITALRARIQELGGDGGQA